MNQPAGSHSPQASRHLGKGAQHTPFAPLDYGLYALTVASWSVSWYALSLQPGVVANEVSLAYRFMIAAAIMVVWVLVSGRQIRFPLRLHAIFAAMGVFIFSTNFLLFYYGSGYLVSGLLSVVFSTASLFNMLLGALIFGQKPNAKTILAALIGFFGIALMFWPEAAARGIDGGVLTGLALCLCGTMCFSIGSVLSSRLQGITPRIPLVSANMWGMIYGTLWCAFLAILQGEAWTWDARPAYAISLVFLAVVSTVIAFAAYLTLVGRIGSGRAGYATVVFPVFALLLSTFVEGYDWTIAAGLGLAMVMIGNIMIMRGR